MPILESLAMYVRRVAELFPKFITQRSRIDDLKREIKARVAPLERELRLLGAEVDSAEKELAETVKVTGSMLVAGYVLETEDKTQVKRTAIGVKELLDAMKTHAPTAARSAATVLARLEEEKRIANQAAAVVTTEFVYRKAERHETASVHVAI